MRLAIIIPCFQEESRLPETFGRIASCFASGALDPSATAIVFVNDGSTDGTSRLLREFAEGKAHVHVVDSGENRGKGGAIKRGIEAVEADAYGYTDADLSYGLARVPEILGKLASDEVVVGVRDRGSMSDGYPAVRRTISHALRFLTRFLTGARVADTQCGFKFFSKRVAKEVVTSVEQDRFSFDVAFLTTLAQEGIPVRQMPVTFVHDDASSVRMHDGLRYVLDLFGVYDALPVRGRRFSLLLLGIPLALVFVLFSWILTFGHFFSDDFTWLWYGLQVAQDPSQILYLQAASFFSPVMNGFYALFFGVLRAGAPAFFLIGLLVHVAVAFLSGWLALDLSRSRLTAILTTALVAVAGSAYEPLVWIGANMHSIVTLFILSSLLAYWRYLGAGKRSWLIVSVAFLLLAFGTKELSIALPPLLLLLVAYRHWQYKDISRSGAHLLFWIATSISTAAYLALQFIFQTSGTALQSGSYALGPAGLLRYPFAILDLFAPFQAVDHLVSYPLAIVLLLLLAAAIAFAGHRAFRRLPLALICLFAIVVTILPTIFFRTEAFWEPLASRYTYLPHVFSSILVAAVLAHLVRRNTSRRVIHSFVLVLLALVGLQFFYMRSVTLDHYAYVYRTGSTLEHAARLIARDKPEAIYVHPEHPFRDNTAHIAGALVVFGELREDQIVFLDEGEVVATDPAHMLLYWNPDVPQYELTSKPDILYEDSWETTDR